MLRMTFRMRVHEGAGPAFEEAWEKVAVAASRADGNVRQFLVRTGQRDYVATTDWVDQASFDVLERSAEHRALMAALFALRESAQREVGEVLAHFEGAHYEGEERR